jgi:hypothetical protein
MSCFRRSAPLRISESSLVTVSGDPLGKITATEPPRANMMPAY